LRRWVMKNRKIPPVPFIAAETTVQLIVSYFQKVSRKRRFSVFCWASLFLIILALFQLGSNALAQTIQEIRVRWDTNLPGPPPKDARSVREPASNVFTLLERRTFSGKVPRQRNPEVTSDQIVVIAHDVDGQLVDWQLIPDPLVLRSEQPGPKGDLRGQTLYRTSADFLITLPADPTIKRIDLYHPRWTGTDFVLEFMGTVPLT
jgi:hypothetical protein